MIDELGHQQGPRWMGAIHHRGSQWSYELLLLWHLPPPLGPEPGQRLRMGVGVGNRAKRTSLGDEPVTMGICFLSHFKAERYFIEFAAGARSKSEK